MRLSGLEAAQSLLVPAADSWPEFELANRVEPGPYDEVELVSPQQAELRLKTGGRVPVSSLHGLVG